MDNLQFTFYQYREIIKKPKFNEFNGIKTPVDVQALDQSNNGKL